MDTVRRIYRLFVEEGRPEREIASILNDEGTLTDFGRPWTRGTVDQVLSNEKYIVLDDLEGCLDGGEIVVRHVDR